MKKLFFFLQKTIWAITFLGIFTSVWAQPLIPCYKGGLWGFRDLEGNIIIACKYNDVNFFIDGVAHVKMGEKTGLINREGQEIASCDYDMILNFHKGIAVAKKNGKYGLLSIDGQEVVAFEYDFAVNFENGLARTRKDKLWGCVNTAGSFVVPVEYEHVSAPIDGLIKAQKNGNWGLLDTNGITLIPCNYQEIGDKLNHFRLVKQDNLWGLVNEGGALVVPCRYASISPFKEGKAKVTTENGQGYIDAQGHELIPCKYKGFNYFAYNDLLEHYLSLEWQKKEAKIKTQYQEIQSQSKIAYLWVKQNNLFGMIDTNEHLVVPFRYDSYEKTETGFIVQSGGKMGWVNNAAKEKISCTYNVLAEIKSGWLKALEESGWTIIDSSGQRISNQYFDEVADFSGQGFFTVRQGNDWGMINVKGEMVVPCQYEKIHSIYAQEQYFIVQKNKKEGLYIAGTGESIPCFYDDLEYTPNDLLIVKQNGKFGLITQGGLDIQSVHYDRVTYKEVEFNGQRMSYYNVEQNYHHGICDAEGKEIISCIYDQTLDFEKDFFIANQGGKLGLLGVKGEVFIPCKYEKIGNVNKEGYITVTNDHLTGLIHTTKGEILPCKYDNITLFRKNPNLIRVKIGSSYGLMDLTGKELLQLKYTQIEDFESNIAILQFDSKWQLYFVLESNIDATKYEEIEPFQAGFAWVKLDGKRGIVDKKGKSYFSQSR